jgi:RecJ-like exonuclease
VPKKSKDDNLEICSKCGGDGFTFVDKDTARVCFWCKGKGKVDFITNIIGPSLPTFSEYLSEQMAERMKEAIDEDVMGQLLGDKNDRNI